MNIMPPIYVDTLKIAAHWMPALINDDYSGLSDADQSNLDCWFDEYKYSGAIYTFNVSDDTDLAIDTVTCLLADCYTVQVFEV